MPFDLPNSPWLIDLRAELRRSGDLPLRPAGAIRYLVVHHSAAPRDDSAEAINNFHIDERGWEGIGYHFLVHWDGRTEYVADVLEVRAGVYARNHEIVSVCLPGDWSHEAPPAAAIGATRQLLGGLRQALGALPIVGHRDIAVPGWETACPGDTWASWRAALVPERPSADGDVYIVRPGDTLGAIARRYGTTVAELARLNGIANPDFITIGQRLVLRPGSRTHVVRRGDTLWSIARRYETTVDALLRLNPRVLDRNLIFPGQALRVD